MESETLFMMKSAKGHKLTYHESKVSRLVFYFEVYNFDQTIVKELIYYRKCASFGKRVDTLGMKITI